VREKEKPMQKMVLLCCFCQHGRGRPITYRDAVAVDYLATRVVSSAT
jgi:hypothetical protein